MPNELKPCPFCGGKAQITQKSYGYGGGEFTADFEVSCANCKISFKSQSTFTLENGYPKVIKDGYAEVTSKWNRRADNGCEYNK